MRSGSELSLTEARRIAITAQGLAKPRPKGPIGRRHLRALVDTIGTIQLDAINVVARTQFIVPFSRLGAYDVTQLQRMTGAHGELFEYWAHAACLLPVTRRALVPLAHGAARAVRRPSAGREAAQGVACRKRRVHRVGARGGARARPDSPHRR